MQLLLIFLSIATTTCKLVDPIMTRCTLHNLHTSGYNQQHIAKAKMRVLHDSQVSMNISETKQGNAQSSPHYSDVIMGAMASQITSPQGADQRKRQSSASLAFVRGIHRRPENSPHKRPVTRKMFPFDDVIMLCTFHGMNSIIVGDAVVVVRYRRHAQSSYWKVMKYPCKYT